LRKEYVDEESLRYQACLFGSMFHELQAVK
jgi:hypothetical protein